MPQLDELANRPKGRGGCPACGEPVEVQVEISLYRLPPLKSGASRGPHVKSKSVRMCAKHGLAIYRIVESPRRQQRPS